jgi:hypothetical protein
MGGDTRIYTPAEAKDTEVILAKHLLENAETLDGNDEYDCFRWFENPLGQQIDLLRLISADLNSHVYCIAWQSLVDAFIYHHFEAGRMVRSLIHGCTHGGWEVVAGKPELWEAELLFDPVTKKHLLQEVKDAASRTEIID